MSTPAQSTPIDDYRLKTLKERYARTEREAKAYEARAIPVRQGRCLMARIPPSNTSVEQEVSTYYDTYHY